MCLPSEGLGPKMCRSCVACIVPCQACATQWWCFGGCGRARYGLLFRWHHVSKNVKSWTRQDSEYFSCVVSFVSLHIIPLTQSSKRLFKHIETTWTELNYIVLLGSPCQHLSWLWKERERQRAPKALGWSLPASKLRLGKDVHWKPWVHSQWSPWDITG